MFKVIFEGLIALVRIPNSTVTRAVLIRDVDHVPMLWVENSDLDPFPPPHPLPDLPGGPASQTRFNLDTQLLTIGLPSGVATKHVGGFDDHVPNLSDALQGDQSLDADIFGATLHANAYAYVDFEGGTLEPVTCFDPQVEWSVANVNLPICIARSVLFSIDSASPVTVKNTNAQEFTVTNPGTLHISNRKYGGNHFLMYQNIAAKATGISEPKETLWMCVQCSPTNEPFPSPALPMAGMDMKKSGHASERATQRVQFDPTVECTNSQWP